MVRVIRQQIMGDDSGLPCYPRASQNIAVMAALLDKLPEANTPDEHRAQREIQGLLGLAAQLQAESSMSR